MNTKLRKNVVEMIHEVMNLAIEISNDESNQIDLHCMYCGHINSFDVSIYENGMLSQSLPSIVNNFSLDDLCYDSTFVHLSEFILILEDIKNTGKIDYSKLVAYGNPVYTHFLFEGG